MNIGARVHTEGRLFTARRARTAFSVLENQGCWPDIQGCQSLIFESLRFFFNFFSLSLLSHDTWKAITALAWHCNKTSGSEVD